MVTGKSFNVPTDVINLIDVFNTLGIDKRIGWKLFVNPKYWTFDLHRGHPDLAYIPYIGGGEPGKAIRFWRNRTTDMNFWTTNSTNKKEMIKRFRQLHPAVVGKIMKINIDLRERTEEAKRKEEIKNRTYLKEQEEKEIIFTGMVETVKSITIGEHTGQPRSRVRIDLGHLSCPEIDHCHIHLPIPIYIKLGKHIQIGYRIKCSGKITKYTTEDKWGIKYIKIIES